MYCIFFQTVPTLFSLLQTNPPCFVALMGGLKQKVCPPEADRGSCSCAMNIYGIYACRFRAKKKKKTPFHPWCCLATKKHEINWIWGVSHFSIYRFVWKCWVNIPNEIAIFHRDNDQQNHWVQWGTLFSDTPICAMQCPKCNLDSKRSQNGHIPILLLWFWFALLKLTHLSHSM